MSANFSLGTEVFTPNFTSRNEIQTNWQYHSNSCGRPAADYNISIFCRTLNEAINDNWQPYIVSPGSDFESFSDCCPRNKANNEWMLQRDCQASYCYTSDLGVAGNFSRCINETANRVVENAMKDGKLNDTGRADVGMWFGRCEYIDYEKLKKGIVKSPTSDSGAQQSHIWSLKAVMTGLGVGMLVIGNVVF